MKCDNFIKGICIEFADKSKFSSKEYAENCKSTGLFLDDFVKRDDIFQTYKDCGINHLFLHAIIKPCEDNPNIITVQNFCSYDCDNSQEYYLNRFYEKCYEYGINPCIKIMIDETINMDYVINFGIEKFFTMYRNIIDYILDMPDPNRRVKIITLANETTILRRHEGFKEQWKYLIDYLHKKYNGIKISASQWCNEMLGGEYDIADLLDFVGINRYPRNKKWSPSPSVEEMLPECYNDNAIYAVQQFCKEHNTKFMITECGVESWRNQVTEPEKGGSQHDFYGQPYDVQMQANYTKACLISSMEMDYCIGHNIIMGCDYDVLFKFNYQNPLKGSIPHKIEGFEAVKSVWKENE